MYLPDVGKTPATYQLRYARRADGAVVEVGSRASSRHSVPPVELTRVDTAGDHVSPEVLKPDSPIPTPVLVKHGTPQHVEKG